jgi:pyrroline-5-carboxylate reductase
MKFIGKWVTNNRDSCIVAPFFTLCINSSSIFVKKFIQQTMYTQKSTVGAGVTVWSCTENVNADERKKIKSILDSFGKSVFVDDESFIDMSTSISGSGPAYIFLLMEAMIDAGVHMGFSRETATTLVHHTLLGSTKFAMETGEHPAVLRNSVTSPAGTTASAIYELENGKFRTVIKDAIWACYRRSLEMGGKCSQVGPNRVSSVGSTVTLDARNHHPVEPPTGEMKRKFTSKEVEK